jgi:hypothetical protein
MSENLSRSKRDIPVRAPDNAANSRTMLCYCTANFIQNFCEDFFVLRLHRLGLTAIISDVISTTTLIEMNFGKTNRFPQERTERKSFGKSS